METITLERTDQKDLRFNGELLAVCNNKNPYNDGGRWTVYALYKTEKGKFVCSIERVTRWQGESDHSEVTVCQSESDVIEALGQSDAAKSVYIDAGIDNVEIV
jgi:poly-beta-hydroxyalkanoate depolymerase